MYKWIETIGPAARKDRGTSHHEIYVTERQPDMTMTTTIDETGALQNDGERKMN
jgi:hypothetical protein